MVDITSVDSKETVLMYVIKKAEIDSQKEVIDAKCKSKTRIILRKF